MKPITELTDLEAEKRLTELLGGCAHKFDSQHGLGMNCLKCKRSVNQCRPKQYATSYNDIIPVIQGMGMYSMERLNLDIYIDTQPEMKKAVGYEELYTDAMLLTPRQLLNAVIEVLESE